MDRVIVEFISGIAGRFFILDTVGIIIAKYLPFLFGALFFAFILKYEGWQKRLFAFLFTAVSLIVSSGIIQRSIEFFYDKHRPFELLDIEPLITVAPGFSFPSGHATFFFTLALCVFIMNRKWGGWFLTFAILNGFARIFVGVHWPMDIIAGIIVALISFTIVYLLLRDTLDTIMNETETADEIASS